ncbi:SDR family oxidoreductase [Curtobacterium sp. B18]|uniref:SDR family oxidoreductase n=1 Tax=Curtobacterium sp. B18 TaxID=95614 RepID=UPI00034AB375|nr:SDR family oxidoreductase [Curtobacterium sp. B18]
MTLDTAPTDTAPTDVRPEALVVGASGITGSALVDHLLGLGWAVTALSRRPLPRDGVRTVAADLRDPDSLRTALAGERPTHVFFTAWQRQETEAENIRVNGGMVRDLLAALDHAPLAHVALVTGLKHYLGPFEAYAAGEMPETPFHEEEPRLDTPNFYYAQEDELFAAAERQGFTWSVHRSHTVIGHAVGNAMNMGLTIAVQATLAKELDLDFVFPGSAEQWNGLTDMTDAGLLAEHMVWASTTPAGADQLGEGALGPPERGEAGVAALAHVRHDLHRATEVGVGVPPRGEAGDVRLGETVALGDPGPRGLVRGHLRFEWAGLALEADHAGRVDAEVRREPGPHPAPCACVCLSPSAPLAASQ